MALSLKLNAVALNHIVTVGRVVVGLFFCLEVKGLNPSSNNLNTFKTKVKTKERRRTSWTGLPILIAKKIQLDRASYLDLWASSWAGLLLDGLD